MDNCSGCTVNRKGGGVGQTMGDSEEFNLESAQGYRFTRFNWDEFAFWVYTVLRQFWF